MKIRRSASAGPARVIPSACVRRTVPFCVTGKSQDYIFEKKGCICPTCPVRATLGLKKAYYCIRGAEQEQR